MGEFKRVLRSAARRAMQIEQSHWPRRRSDVDRTMRLHAYAESKGAFPQSVRKLMETAQAWAVSQGRKTTGGHTKIVPAEADALGWCYLPYLPERTAQAIRAKFGSCVKVVRRSSVSNY